MNTKNLVREVQKRVAQDADGYYPGAALVQWFGKAGDAQLWRINAFELAGTLSGSGAGSRSGPLAVKREQLLATFIRLVRDGVLDLNWDFHCTNCNAVAGTHNHLREATAGNHCPLCNMDFRNDLARNVEVTFTPSGRWFTLDRGFLEEQTRQVVQAHKEKRIRLPAVYVSGLDCLHVPLFRQMFESDTLSLRESLAISQVCIMFTDIKGSTELYDRLGDSTAYGLVRDHFDVLFKAVEDHHGVIVKTIGDSVMASFRRPADGVAAALGIREAFAGFNRRENLKNEVIVKIGLHAGPTIMVNLNNRLDYFGQVVNMAARIQGTADGGQIVVSSAVRQDADAVARMKGRVKALRRRVENLKGISARQTTFRLEFAEEAAAAQAHRVA